MRKVVPLLMSLGVLVVGGVALAATIDCVGGTWLCEGTEEADTLRGTPERHLMKGLDGDDKLYGKAGSDRMIGGKGDDLVLGGPGRDDTRSGFREEHLGSDTIYGGDDHDFMVDGVGSNHIWGGAGNDRITSKGELSLTQPGVLRGLVHRGGLRAEYSQAVGSGPVTALRR